MSDLDFQTYKGIGTGLFLLILFLIQFIIPYSRDMRAMLRNSKTNFSLAAVNLIIFNIICFGCVCSVAVLMDAREFGLMHLVDFAPWLRVLATVVLLDFVAFAWHRINHELPLLWRFHGVHHSDSVFDSSTAFRFHPGELLISLGVRIAMVALFGLPVIGILAFELVYGFFNIFVHGNICLPYRVEKVLGWVFITPALHRKHHSQKTEDLNSNFGTIFSFWDRSFGKFSNAKSSEKISVGLPGKDIENLGLMGLLQFPAKKFL